MFVIPFSMGPVGGPLSKIGIQVRVSDLILCKEWSMKFKITCSGPSYFDSPFVGRLFCVIQIMLEYWCPELRTCDL